MPSLLSYTNPAARPTLLERGRACVGGFISGDRRAVGCWLRRAPVVLLGWGEVDSASEEMDSTAVIARQLEMAERN